MDEALTFGILGPIEAKRGGNLISLGRPKQRAVLAILLLHVDEVVSTDRLVALLWDASRAAPSVGALQTYVSNLRRALEPDRPPREQARTLVSQAGGYRLAVDPARLDAVRFESGARLGTRLLAEGRPSEAREALAQAMSLWRGPPLADFTFSAFAQPEISRLEKLRLLALEAGLEADLALGAHDAAIPALEQLVVEHPLRERLWGSLMLALYRSGRQAEALRAYQRCRAALNVDLGIEPGPELRRLEAGMLAQDPSLDGRPAASSQPAHAGPVLAPPDAAARAPLIGRRREVARLRAAWDVVRHSAGGLVLVTGEAGIGKTRLVEELAGIAALGGARVIWGRCCEAEEAPAFWPWSQVVSALLAELAPGAVGDALRSAGLGPADLAPVAPARPADPHAAGAVDVGSGAVAVGSGEARFRLSRAVAALGRAAAGDRPVLVVIEDLHWADPPSLELLRFLADDLATGPCAVVLTYRHAEARERPPVVEALATVARQRVLERIDLAGLAAAEVRPFIEAVTDVEVDAQVVGAVHRRTEGNPFFMSELVRLLESEGRLADEAAAQDSPVPLGVRDVTRRRLSYLPGTTQKLLDLAAVIGQEFDLDILSSASGTDDQTALDDLEPALASGMVLEVADWPRRYRFSHALVREALYEDLSALRRARLHGRTAEALEVHRGCDAAAPELARHFFLASRAVGPERCIPYLLHAAGTAMEHLAHENAELHLRRAVALLRTMPAGERRDRRELWVQTRLALVLGTTAGPGAPEVAKVFARARSLCGSHSKEATELPMIYGPFLFAWAAGDPAGAHQYADQLLGLADRTEDPRYLLGGHLAKGLILFDQGQLAAAASRFEHVTVLADTLGDAGLAQVLHADPRVTGRLLLHHTRALADPSDRSHALVDEGLALAREIEHPYTEAVALAMTLFSEVLCDRPDAAEAAAEVAIEFSSAHAFSHLASASLGMRGWAVARRGDTPAGLVLLRRHLKETDPLGISRVRHFHLALMAEAELLAGLFDDAVTTARQGLLEATTSGSCFYLAELHRIRGAALLSASPTVVATEGEAEAAYLQAAAVARRQGALRLVERAESCRRERGVPVRARS